MITQTDEEFRQRFEPIITRVKRHNGHVKAQENQAYGQASLVEGADIEPAEQYLIPVIQENTQAGEHENIAQYNRSLEWYMDMHALNYRKYRSVINLFGEGHFGGHQHQHYCKYFF